MPRVALEDFFNIEANGDAEDELWIAGYLRDMTAQAVAEGKEAGTQFNCFDVFIRPQADEVEIVDVLYGQDFLPLILRVSEFMGALENRMKSGKLPTSLP